MKDKIEVVSDKVPEFLYPFYLGKIFKEHTGNNLNLIFPRTLSEKIQWLKLYDATPEKTMWSDKLKARELFAEKIEGGEKYLKPLINVWKNFDDINFEELPNSFILKSNNGSGFNSFIMNKTFLLKNKNQLKKLERTNSSLIPRASANFINLKCCKPNGIPIIVKKQPIPVIILAIADTSPTKIHQNILKTILKPFIKPPK